MQELDGFLSKWAFGGTDQVGQVGALSFFMLLMLSVAASLFVSALYLRFYAGRSTGSQIHASFPLLGPAITAIFICIQFSLPLSLGLLGALSIVRFRTPIKEPEEIGFIMLLISTSLACATFNLVFLVVILVVALLTLILRRFAPAVVSGPSNDGSLIVSLTPESYEKVSRELVTFFGERLRGARIESVTRNDEETVLALAFKSMPASGLVAVERDLQKLAQPTTFTILYNRPGAL